MVKTVPPALLTTSVVKLIRKGASSVQSVTLQRKLDQRNVDSVFLLLFAFIILLQGKRQKT